MRWLGFPHDCIHECMKWLQSMHPRQRPEDAGGTGAGWRSEPVAIEVSVDLDLCIGSGDCVRIAPTGFRIDEDLGVSQPLPGAALLPEAVLLDAARTCPTQSIRLVVDGRVVHDSNGGR